MLTPHVSIHSIATILFNQGQTVALAEQVTAGTLFSHFAVSPLYLQVIKAAIIIPSTDTAKDVLQRMGVSAGNMAMDPGPYFNADWGIVTIEDEHLSPLAFFHFHGRLIEKYFLPVRKLSPAARRWWYSTLIQQRFLEILDTGV